MADRAPPLSPEQIYFGTLKGIVGHIGRDPMSDAEARAYAIEVASGGAPKTDQQRAEYRDAFLAYAADRFPNWDRMPSSPPTGLPDFPAVDVPPGLPNIPPGITNTILVGMAAAPVPSAPPRRPARRPPRRSPPKPPPRRYPRRPLPKIPDVPKYPRVPRIVPRIAPIVIAEAIGRAIAKVVEWEQRGRIDAQQAAADKAYEDQQREFRVGIENENRRIDAADRQARTIPQVGRPELIPVPRISTFPAPVPVELPTPQSLPTPSAPAPAPSAPPTPAPVPGTPPVAVPRALPRWLTPLAPLPFLSPRAAPRTKPGQLVQTPPGRTPASPLTPLKPGKLELPAPSAQPKLEPAEDCRTVCRRAPKKRKKKKTKKVCKEIPLTKNELAEQAKRFAKRKGLKLVKGFLQ